ncbi:hypothetical protein TNCV_2959171 [Trichonephila clavipes]|nr:hypothetical protein TNCV_2959171 [Trichonephila clavipes]
MDFLSRILPKDLEGMCPLCMVFGHSGPGKALPQENYGSTRDLLANSGFGLQVIVDVSHALGTYNSGIPHPAMQGLKDVCYVTVVMALYSLEEGQARLQTIFLPPRYTGPEPTVTVGR